LVFPPPIFLPQPPPVDRLSSSHLPKLQRIPLLHLSILNAMTSSIRIWWYASCIRIIAILTINQLPNCN
jgi:hypothetical protein